MVFPHDTISCQAYDEAAQEDIWLDQRLADMTRRGITPGFKRNRVDRSRALIVGCNYARTQATRLWGAVADARSWAHKLVSRMGVPEQNLALLVDEDDDGKPINEASPTYPSQKNILEHLGWLTNAPEAGDLIVFIFCGRGAVIASDEGRDWEEDGVDGSDAEEDGSDCVGASGSEEGLLCADYARSDWIRGYSSRVLTSSMLSSFWQTLPRGAALTLVIDAENGITMLPVSRRLDCTHMPNLGSVAVLQPEAIPEALVFGRPQPRLAPLFSGSEEDSTPTATTRGDRGPAGIQPRKRWFHGRFLWEVTGLEESSPAIQPEVQAFALIAAAPGGWAFEGSLHVPSRSPQGIAGRRGILTQCLLQALEELNHQCSYYALWWNAIRILRAAGIRDQHFFLLFNDGADPLGREVFEPVGVAEAKAYAKRSSMMDQAELDEDDERQCHTLTCMKAHRDFQSPPLSARSPRSTPACGCSSPSAPECVVT